MADDDNSKEGFYSDLQPLNDVFDDDIEKKQKSENENELDTLDDHHIEKKISIFFQHQKTDS